MSLDPRSRGEQQRAQSAVVHNNRGGITLSVDPASGRLRSPRKSEFHSPDCGCQHCRRVCCIFCHDSDASKTEPFIGLPGFGRHIQQRHPGEYQFSSQRRLDQRIVRALAQRRLNRELQTQENLGIRKIPIGKITPQTVAHLEAEVRASRRKIREGSYSRRQDSLFLSAIEEADRSIRPNLQRDLDRQVRRLLYELEAGDKTGIPPTVERKTLFDPRVAIELLKLEYGLNRSWSFVVHLVCVYGINALVEAMQHEGIVPPTYIPMVARPSDIIEKELEPLRHSIIETKHLRGAAKKNHEKRMARLEQLGEELP